MFGDGAGQLPGVTPVEHPATRRPEYTGTGLRKETFAGLLLRHPPDTSPWVTADVSQRLRSALNRVQS